jgi:hypothetical protein
MFASPSPPFYGGLILDASGLVQIRNLSLPMPWFSRISTSMLHQELEDGLRTRQSVLQPGQVAFFDDCPHLKDVKIWLLKMHPRGPCACIATGTTWPPRGAFRVLMNMLDDPRGVCEAPTFLSTTPPEDALDAVSKKLGSAKQAIQGAVDAACIRGEHIASLETKAETVSSASARYFAAAEQAKRVAVDTATRTAVYASTIAAGAAALAVIIAVAIVGGKQR